MQKLLIGAACVAALVASGAYLADRYAMASARHDAALDAFCAKVEKRATSATGTAKDRSDFIACGLHYAAASLDN